jgi:hypothetical protein
MAVIAWLAPAAPQPQRFTAPPFTLDFAAVSR